MGEIWVMLWPEKRLQTVRTLQERLGVTAPSKTPPPEPATEPSTIQRPRNTALWVVFGVLTMTLVGLLGGGYWQWKASELARQREAAQLEVQRLALEREQAARLEAERRLAELAAKQLVEQRRLQELQRQREEAAANALQENQLAELRRQNEELRNQSAALRRQAQYDEQQHLYAADSARNNIDSSSDYPVQYAHINSPSFNCAGKLTRIERSICENPSLARADGVMSAIYRELRTRLDSELSFELLKNQRAWVKRRNSICVDQDVYECTIRMTNKRISEMLEIRNRF